MDEFNMNSVFVLMKYKFYESEEIILISEDYEKVKKHFDKLVKESDDGMGYHIHKYEYDKLYNQSFSDNGELMDWITIDYKKR